MQEKVEKEQGAKVVFNPLRTEDLTFWKEFFLGRHFNET